MTTPYIEGYLPFIQYHGLNTTKSVSLEGTNTLSGATTISGALTVSGALAISNTVAMTSTITGIKPVVVNVTGNTTLTAAQSGCIVTFNKATGGATVTLPAPAVGLNYTFVVGTTVTAQSNDVLTDAGTTLLMGSVVLGTDDTASKSFLANGTTHIRLSMNGTTKGGIIGSNFTAVCVSATQWAIGGNLAASGTLVTPFATS